MEFIDPATLSNQKPQRSLCLHFPLAGIAGLYHRTWLYCMGSELGSSNLSSKHLATCAPPGLHISLGPHKCRAFEEFEAFSVRSPHVAAVQADAWEKLQPPGRCSPGSLSRTGGCVCPSSEANTSVSAATAPPW